MVQRIARRAAAVAVGLTLAAAGLAVTAPAAQAATMGHTAANVEPLTNVHNCTKLGDDTITQAVVCADVIVGANEFYSQAEAYCQNLHTLQIVQCSNIDIVFEAWRFDGTQWIQKAQLARICGHSFGQCPAARFVNSTPWIIGDCGESAFTRIDGALPWNTFIDLPGTNLRETLNGVYDSTSALIPC